MPRLTNAAGAVVNVPEEKVPRLGDAWSRVEDPSPSPAVGDAGAVKPKPRRSAPAGGDK